MLIIFTNHCNGMHAGEGERGRRRERPRSSSERASPYLSHSFTNITTTTTTTSSSSSLFVWCSTVSELVTKLYIYIIYITIYI